MSQLSQRIRDWRRTRGETQQKACGRLGVSQATLSDWESGAVVPGDAALRRMVRVLRVPLALLLVEASEAAQARAAQTLRQYLAAFRGEASNGRYSHGD